MATWIVHLRIAEIFLKKYNVPFEREFILGSVSPDCGYGKKDSYGEFDPPPKITHFAPEGVKLLCEYNRFFDIYVKDKKINEDYCFYFGYYIHLLTDVMWSSMMYMPTKIKYVKEYEKNPQFLQIIKHDWSDLDFKYLCDNPNFMPLEVIKHAGDVKDYMPFYEPGQLTNQIKFIGEYYSKEQKHELDREYEYLTEQDIQTFINLVFQIIDIDLKNKKINKQLNS